MEVTTQAEFIAAIGNNVTISLKGNIALMTHTSVADYKTGIVIPDDTTGLVIDGNGFSIDGGHKMRCMYVGDGADVQINDRTVTNGYVYVRRAFPVYL